MSESGSSQPIICEKCEISFKMQKGLNAHIRKFHPEQEVLVNRNQICGMCDGTFRTIALLQEHLESWHSVGRKYVSETFYSDEEFLNWKEKIEKDSLSSFVLRNHSERKEMGKRLSYYICHWSGYFKPKKERTRHLKASGSVKSGCICPAIMNVTKQTVDDIVEISVRYQSVHVGHELETGKLRLTKAEKENLAADLNLGIPMSKILDKTRQNFSSTNTFSLTTRKDLQNIRRDFQLREESVYDANDSTSVDILVQKLINESDDPVLIYEAMGHTLPNYPSIHQDFLLVLMNDAQEKLLGLYGSSCIMIDSTHGTNQYNFELTTLMVHDENHEGLPVATLFSSRTGSDILLPFFESIKKCIPNLQTHVLMTDDTNSYLNAWELTFDAKETRLFCIWHVNRNINRNINIKVKNSNNRSSIKTEIKDIVTEIDVTTFNNLTLQKQQNIQIHFQTVLIKPYFLRFVFCYLKNLYLSYKNTLKK
ncbi:hypothetical protein AVEN_168589-1 [Araneus ventricosus]|uniref:C2H2-type domain-containing protein n=1 Tax=Araneus ventricosus TaxID=182803 RepID=A0A4Y2KFR5_ARAVE|nr:hypothetical protein AVEN_168589-1 [Araneus ventricosus]